MVCIAKQTKVLEAAVRELRGELTACKNSSKGVTDLMNASEEAIVLSDMSQECAGTLKHIRGFYDQTRYLKGLINTVYTPMHR